MFKAITLSPETKNKELDALIRLLDEPSEDVFVKIKEKLVFYGMDAIPVLESAWDNSFDNLIQCRIEEIIHNIQQIHLREELQEWHADNHFDLLKGFYLISKYQYPDLDFQEISNKVEILKRDIWLELNSGLTALEKVKVINLRVVKIISEENLLLVKGSVPGSKGSYLVIEK